VITTVGDKGGGTEGGPEGKWRLKRLRESVQNIDSIF
jgi:hypothetical protein